MESASGFISRLDTAEERVSVLETASEGSSKSKEKKNSEYPRIEEQLHKE